ncbi:MAG: hypothetical protein A2V83_05715 [Nitrospirae bacterium RBG_16_64_22]|nr:MAG: hypothetical protein A2V83_05715 [Nitrospirae bacterium RBG_16_64_22]
MSRQSPRLVRFLAVLILIGAVPPGRAEALDLPIKKLVFENGMTVLLLERPSLPFVVANAKILGGSLYDPEDRPGTASLTATLLTHGTASRSAIDLAEALDSVGASISSSSADDFASVSLTALKKDVQLGFEILADVMMNPSFSENEIAREKAQVLARIKSDLDDPARIADKLFASLVFKNHPYAHPVEGTEESLGKIGREDLAAFYKRYYKPNNVVMAVVGDITEEETIEIVNARFGRWPFRNVEPPAIRSVPKTSRTVKVVSKDLKQATIRLGHPGIRRSSPDYYAAYVMNHILGGGGFSSRMMARVRDEKGLAYDIRSGFDAGLEPGAFSVSVQTKNETAPDAVEMALEEINRIRKTVVSEAELADAKSYLIGSFPLRLDTNRKIAAILSSVEFYGLGLDYFESYPRRIDSVSREEVLKMARKHLNPKNYVLVIVGKPDASRLP